MPEPSLIEQLPDIFKSGKEGIEFVKTVIRNMPNGKKKEKAKAELAKIERAMKLKEAETAQTLGYKLCKCTFPPQNMLSEGYHKRYNKEIFRCPKCGKQTPSEHYFAQMDRSNEAVRQYVNRKNRRV